MPQREKPIKRIIIATLLAVVLAFAAYPLYMNEYSVRSIHKTNKNKTAIVHICGQQNAFKIKSPSKDFKVFHNQINIQNCAVLDLPIKRKFIDYQFEVLAEQDGAITIQLTAPELAGQYKNYHIFVDFAKLMLNNKLLFKDSVAVTYSQPYIYKTDINSDKPLQISLAVRKHILTFADLTQTYSLSFLVLFTVVVLAFLLAYKLVNYLAGFKLTQNYSRIDIVFVSIFFIFLYVPMSYISPEEISTKENRVLAKYPALLGENGINIQFGKKFENWFNDRFFGRRFLLSTEDKIKGLLEPHKGNKKVLVGKEGWLFYKGGNGINNFANKSKLSQHQLEKGLKYLMDIDEWSKTHGKKFYYVLVPDKNRVYGEYVQYIQKIRPDSESIDNQWINYIHHNSNVNVMYLYDVLMQNKDKGLLYWKEDTHWNYFGSYIGYQEIMKELAKDNNITVYEVLKWQDEKKPKVDLSRMYPYSHRDKEAKYKEPIITDKASSCTSIEEEDAKNTVICHNPKQKLKAFILRDSFSNTLIPYYAETFGEVKLVWHYDITQDNLAEIADGYDIIILENVARFLPKILNQTFPKD